MHIGIRPTVTLVTLCIVGLCAGNSNLQAEEHRSDAEHCVSLTRIQSTDIIDDRNILFYMKGGDVYLNTLPHKCPGLKFEDRLMYRTSIGQLCDMDIITVLMDAGFGLQGGASCGLGMFRPIGEEEAKQLKAASDD